MSVNITGFWSGLHHPPSIPPVGTVTVELVIVTVPFIKYFHYFQNSSGAVLLVLTFYLLLIEAWTVINSFFLAVSALNWQIRPTMKLGELLEIYRNR